MENQSGKRGKRHCTFEELQVILHSKPLIILTPSVVQSSSSPLFLRLFLGKEKERASD